MEPIRVAQVMGYMNGGGVESVVMNYYRHIDREKVQFDFIVCEGSTLIPREEIEGLGGRVFMVPDYKKMPQYLRALSSLFSRESWRIVHSHMNSLSVFPLYAAKKAGVPVRIAHSHTTSGKDGLVKNVVKNGLCRFSRLYPTDLAACSEKAAAWLFGEDHPYTLFPNGVDVHQFKVASEQRFEYRAQLGFSMDDFVLGHVGRFVRVKNHAFLLDIYAALRQLVPNAKLLLVGDGPLREDVRQKAEELNVADGVIMLGQRADVPNLLSVMDAFCLPSLYEGMPVVGIECQAAGVPALVSAGVTTELRMSSLVEFENLDASPMAWARHVLELVSMPVEYFPDMDKYDIDRCADALCDYYLGFLSE